MGSSDIFYRGDFDSQFYYVFTMNINSGGAIFVILFCLVDDTYRIASNYPPKKEKREGGFLRAMPLKQFFHVENYLKLNLV